VPIHALAGFKRIAPDQDTGMDLYEPWVTALGLFNAGGKSASDIWTYCHKSIYPEAQKGRRLLNWRSAQSII